MQIYMNAGVSLLRFKYPATLKKLYRKCNNMNYIFPNCYFRAKNIIVHIQKIKIKNFIVVVMLLNFSYIFHFSFFPFSMSFLYLLLCEEFLSLFKVPHIFLVILFSFLRTLYNTWKNYYRQLQVSIIVFNKKALLNISSISNSKNPPWNLLSFVSRIVVNKCLKNSVRNCFSFALISNYLKG